MIRTISLQMIVCCTIVRAASPVLVGATLMVLLLEELSRPAIIRPRLNTVIGQRPTAARAPTNLWPARASSNAKFSISANPMFPPYREWKYFGQNRSDFKVILMSARSEDGLIWRNFKGLQQRATNFGAFRALRKSPA